MSKGKYLILVTDSQATIPSEKNRRQNSEVSQMINCDSNCIITKVINPINISITPSTSIADSSGYSATNLHYELFYVEITSDTDTISFASVDSSNNKIPQSLKMDILKFKE